jgi:hypothetical protein
VGSGCGACHALTDAGTTGVSGPVMDGLGELAASRIEGLSAEDYIRQSIFEPGAYIVEGFQPIMPANYGTSLSEEDLNILVEYLLAQ